MYHACADKHHLCAKGSTDGSQAVCPALPFPTTNLLSTDADSDWWQGQEIQGEGCLEGKEITWMPCAGWIPVLCGWGINHNALQDVFVSTNGFVNSSEEPISVPQLKHRAFDNLRTKSQEDVSLPWLCSYSTRSWKVQLRYPSLKVLVCKTLSLGPLTLLFL